jgi:hypothetical protein
MLTRRGYGPIPYIKHHYSPAEISLYGEIEMEAYADELTAQANVSAVAAATGMSGKPDALRSLIATLQGTDAFQGGSDLQGRLSGFLSKKRQDSGSRQVGR